MNQSSNDPKCGAESPTLQEHLFRMDVFKVGLRNSFGIDFRTVKRPVVTSDGERQSSRFHYLGEVFPFIESRLQQLSKERRNAYEALKERAIESFWQLYADFQPMAHSIVQRTGIDADRLDPVLGRSLLLFDASRGNTFVAYLEKSLRESVKNLRGEDYAKQYGLPSSAGRLIPQIVWSIEQSTMRRGRSLSPEEIDALVIEFLVCHRSKFSQQTMQRVADVMREGRRAISLDACYEWLEPSVGIDRTIGGRDCPAAGNDCFVERQDECTHQLGQIQNAMVRAEFDPDERALVLCRLDLPYDQRRYESVARKVTVASLRKRKSRLLVRLLAARYAPQAPRFGQCLRLTMSTAREPIQCSAVAYCTSMNIALTSFVHGLLNWMALSESVYRISIAERGRLAVYLSSGDDVTLSSATFQKLKAALIEQDRLGLPFCTEVN